MSLPARPLAAPFDAVIAWLDRAIQLPPVITDSRFRGFDDFDLIEAISRDG